MKILQIITQSEVIGGATGHMIDLSKKLSQNGHEVIVAAGGRGELKDIIEEHDIDYIPLTYLERDINVWKDLRAAFELYKLIKKINPDLVCPHSAKAGYIGRMAACFARRPSIYTVHGWSSFNVGEKESTNLLYRLMEKIAGYFTDQMICVSNFDYDLAVNNEVVNKKKLHIVEYGLPENGSNSNDSVQNKDNIVKLIMVARFEDQKNHEVLLNALSQLEINNWQLKLVGDGSKLSQMKKLARKVKIDNKIQFLGWNDNVDELLDNSDILF